MLVIASRGSQLALWQARWVEARLRDLGHEARIEVIKTTGDKITDVPLAKVGTKGLFTKEIEEALLEGRADLAVHSLKDLPTELPEGLVLAAVPEREDPRDAIVGLQEQLEQIRAGEVDKIRRRYGPFTAQHEEALEAVTRGIINKIAHGPISELRSQAGKPEGAHVIAAIRKAFHLQE